MERCVGVHLSKGTGGVGFLLGVWGMGSECGMEGLVRRVEEEMERGGWGRWWEGEEWKAIGGDLREEVREKMVRRGMEWEEEGRRNGRKEMNSEKKKEMTRWGMTG